MLHWDIKKRGVSVVPAIVSPVTAARIPPGGEYAHVAIDDHPPVAFSSLHPDETGRSACLALLQALRYYARLGIRVSRLLTDNEACYRSKRLQKLCRRLGFRHLRTKPYTPQTNGKAERFIQPCVNGSLPGAMNRQSNGQNTCNRGCMSTTGIVLMPV